MDPVVLLDTHVLVWLDGAPSKLSKPARKALSNAHRRLLADISLREVAAMSLRAVDFGDVARWLESALAEFEIELVPIDARIAARSVRVAQNFHADPADQLIAATAIELDVPLITADERLRASPAVRTIW